MQMIVCLYSQQHMMMSEMARFRMYRLVLVLIVFLNKEYIYMLKHNSNITIKIQYHESLY